MKTTFKSLVPMLQTEDVKGTIAWYESALGFSCVATQRDEWCHLERDGVTLMFMRNDHVGSPHATAV